MSWLERLKSLPGGETSLRSTAKTDETGGSVSFVSASGTVFLSRKGADGLTDDEREAWEERAAIMEFCGGLSREEAERAAGEAPAKEARRWPLEAWGDMRPCTRCMNLTRGGRCLAAWNGVLRAARDYEPSIPAQPRRCIGYAPPADDPEQSPGIERWPELAEWQASSLMRKDAPRRTLDAARSLGERGTGAGRRLGSEFTLAPELTGHTRFSAYYPGAIHSIRPHYGMCRYQASAPSSGASGAILPRRGAAKRFGRVSGGRRRLRCIWRGSLLYRAWYSGAGALR